MIKIRPNQMEALRRAQRPLLLKKILRFLDRHYPEICASVPEATLKRRLEHALEQAQSLGVTWESALADFAVLSLLCGPNFTDDGKVRTWLDEQNLQANERVAALALRVPRAHWDRLRVAPTDVVWRPVDADAAAAR